MHQPEAAQQQEDFSRSTLRGDPRGDDITANKSDNDKHDMQQRSRAYAARVCTNTVMCITSNRQQHSGNECKNDNIHITATPRTSRSAAIGEITFTRVHVAKRRQAIK